MYYQRLKDPNGSYRATDGTRWELSAARTVRPTTGWAWFETTAAALTAWGLVYDPLPEPADVDALFHRAAPYILTIEPIKK